mgnify:CR=1 FL=1
MQMHGKYLVVAWGGRNRSDDTAVLLALADSLAGQVAQDVEILCVPQLGPELVDDVAGADHVLFIDVHAHPSWPDLVVEEVEPTERCSTGPWYSEPGELLTMSQLLYHRRPAAWLVASRACEAGRGSTLSRRSLKLLDATRRVVLSMLPAAEPGESAGCLPRSRFSWQE